MFENCSTNSCDLSTCYNVYSQFEIGKCMPTGTASHMFTVDTHGKIIKNFWDDGACSDDPKMKDDMGPTNTCYETYGVFGLNWLTNAEPAQKMPSNFLL